MDRYGTILLSAALLTARLGLAAEISVPGDFDTVTEALDAIEADPQLADTVIVEPGTYRETVRLRNNITLRGRETARTFLQGTGTEPAVTADGVSGGRISNFTFNGSRTALRISGGSDLTVTANVFAVGGDHTAIEVLDVSSPEILNNTFFRNATAVQSGGNTLTVRNNAFVENTVVISPAPFDESSIAHNGFFNNADGAVLGANTVTGTSPEFTDPGRLDFHLRQDAPLIDAGTGVDVLDGTTADIGAYGGLFAEGTPFPVTSLSVDQTTATSITLSWPANTWYRLGGYTVRYDNDRSGAPYEGDDADNGVSPIDVGNVTTFTLSGLNPPTPSLLPPSLSPPEPRDRALRLSWSAVAGATGYEVHWGIASIDENIQDVGDTTQFELTGLENGTTYRVAIIAFAQPVYFMVVTAVSAFGANPESAFSEEATAAIGPRVESAPSNTVSDFPEPIVAFPDLPDENGCFIATAAYGHYSAEQVQWLRRFRDRYLLTNAPGRAFVAWYYRHSPPLARQVRRYPALRLAVRAALFPAIITARFLVQTPPALRLLLLVAIAGLLIGVRRGGEGRA